MSMDDTFSENAPTISPQIRTLRLVEHVRPEQEQAFQAQMAQRGLEIRQMAKDGNCLFRSVAHQVYGDDVHHDVVRRKCMDYMDAEQAFFEPYVEGDASALSNLLILFATPSRW